MTSTSRSAFGAGAFERFRSNLKTASIALRARARTARRQDLPGLVPDSPGELGAQARTLFDAGQYEAAEYVLWEVLRTAPRAPAATYLLGLTMLQNQKPYEARPLIDRAYELRHWLDDRVNTPHVFEMLNAAEQACPDWDWPRYQRSRERWRAVGLDVAGAIDHLASITDRPLQFIQIGANDGRSGDPLRDVIGQHGMSGVFVEPQPIPLARLRERYEDASNLRFAQVAITESDGPVDLYTDPTRTTLGTLVPDRNIMRVRSAAAVALRVRGLTFDSFAEEEDIGSFDVLQIDTEGFDYKILRQIPLADRGVSIVNMEYFCLPVAERLAACNLLEEAGFALSFNHMDVLAVRLDQFAERFVITRVGD